MSDGVDWIHESGQGAYHVDVSYEAPSPPTSSAEATKYVTTLNVKTAKGLGLTVRQIARPPTRGLSDGADGPVPGISQSAGWILIHAGEFVARLAHYTASDFRPHSQIRRGTLSDGRLRTLNPLTPACLQA